MTKVPDVLTDVEKAQQVSSSIAQVQREIFATQLRQIAEGREPSDEFGMGSKGELVSFEAHLQDLKAREKNIISEFSDVIPEVEKLNKPPVAPR